MDLLDDVRLGQGKQIIRAFQIARMGGELRAAVSGLIQLVALDHRPHRAVDDEDPLLQRFEKFVHKQKTPPVRGRRPAARDELLPAL